MNCPAACSGAIRPALRRKGIYPHQVICSYFREHSCRDQKSDKTRIFELSYMRSSDKFAPRKVKPNFKIIFLNKEIFRDDR
jgi:hypothetical protein